MKTAYDVVKNDDVQSLQWKKETARIGGEIDSVLLIGQSNMSGRGIIGSVPPIDPKDMMFMLRNGRWQPMTEPITTDRKIFVERDTEFRSGISLAASFAEEYATHYQQRIGLIPCSDGGSSMSEWQPGELLFDSAVMQAKLAQRTSKIRAILWHQGESDSMRKEDVEAYGERFFTMLKALTEELNLEENIPVILGEIFLLPRWPFADQINEVLHRIARSDARFEIASAKDLTLSPDGIHFSGPSYRILGRRYFEAFDKAKNRISNT